MFLNELHLNWSEVFLLSKIHQRCEMNPYGLLVRKILLMWENQLTHCHLSFF